MSFNAKPDGVELRLIKDKRGLGPPARSSINTALIDINKYRHRRHLVATKDPAAPKPPNPQPVATIAG